MTARNKSWDDRPQFCAGKQSNEVVDARRVMHPRTAGYGLVHMSVWSPRELTAARAGSEYVAPSGNPWLAVVCRCLLDPREHIA
jgi:hypothetical protein